jgi:hypothetical protein
MTRRILWLVAAVTLLASGVYTLVYLYRWEWNRALFTSLLFIAIEVGIVAAVVLRRIGRLEQTIDRANASPRVLERIEAAAPERRHFAWLERSVGRTNVFVTVLLGAGLLLSAVTWLVDRIASRTAVSGLEQGLARRLAPAAFPTEPLVPSDAELLAQGGPYGADHLEILLGPNGRPAR